VIWVKTSARQLRIQYEDSAAELTSLTRPMKNNRQRTFIVVTLALIGFPGGLRSAEPQFKQEPAENLRSYFVKAFPPNYPDVAGAQHKKGSGWFRLTIDRGTGKVTEVKVLKSTGVKILDDSAACAFMQWKAKLNRLDHAVVPANFTGSPEKTGSHTKW
jgi:TonB family protein